MKQASAPKLAYALHINGDLGVIESAISHVAVSGSIGPRHTHATMSDSSRSITPREEYVNEAMTYDVA